MLDCSKHLKMDNTIDRVTKSIVFILESLPLPLRTSQERQERVLSQTHHQVH